MTYYLQNLGTGNYYIYICHEITSYNTKYNYIFNIREKRLLQIVNLDKHYIYVKYNDQFKEFFSKNLLLLFENYNDFNKLKTIYLNDKMLGINKDVDLNIKKIFKLDNTDKNINSELVLIDIDNYDYKYLDLILDFTDIDKYTNKSIKIINNDSSYIWFDKLKQFSINRLMRYYKDIDEYDYLDYIENINLTNYGLNYYDDIII